ncbi:hypothetical protein OCU04_002616 [Sclerotinia nivalis]|uniref:Uncharacterized protein n=1 Tax=Sclerotinia nivalis TaxID=352851 RepID=A0A9X0AUP8_9HELO|nr:hypothetical protein OCU04_002616 [Sclerotinia nivalis]
MKRSPGMTGMPLTKEIMDILSVFFTLTKRSEGISNEFKRGILSDYITSLNILIDHIRHKHDDLKIRAETPGICISSIQYLRAYVVNCWTKLNEYSARLDEISAHYASFVTNSKIK